MPTEEPRRPPPNPNAKYAYTPVPYGWEEMKAWDSVEEEDGWRLIGTCPRCGHVTSKFFPDHVIAAMVTIEALIKESALDTDNLRVECNCTAPHEGQKDEVQGCGAYWDVKVARGEER